MTEDEDQEASEGCPDCGKDTVVEDEDGGVKCESCGWRP